MGNFTIPCADGNGCQGGKEKTNIDNCFKKLNLKYLDGLEGKERGKGG